jgi:hypothetical protein
MPRTIQEILDQQEELADKFENFDQISVTSVQSRNIWRLVD